MFYEARKLSRIDFFDAIPTVSLPWMLKILCLMADMNALNMKPQETDAGCRTSSVVVEVHRIVHKSCQ